MKCAVANTPEELETLEAILDIQHGLPRCNCPEHGGDPIEGIYPECLCGEGAPVQACPHVTWTWTTPRQDSLDTWYLELPDEGDLQHAAGFQIGTLTFNEANEIVIVLDE